MSGIIDLLTNGRRAHQLKDPQARADTHTGVHGSVDTTEELATYDLVNEPVDETYRGLLRAAVDGCASFLFVVRAGIPVAESVHALIDALDPELISASQESEWPGTELLGHTETVYRFTLTNEALEHLASATDRLYAWLQPDLPEDLCFLRSDGSPWLATISHERDGFLVLSQAEKAYLADLVPDLALTTQRST